MIEKAVYSALSNDAAVSALVGTRIYPELAPQKTSIPYIVYTRIDTEHQQSKSNDDGLARARVQFNSVAGSYSVAKDLCNKVRLAFTGLAGTVGGVVVQAVIIGGEIDASQFPGDATDEPRYRCVSDFAFWFEESN